MLHQDRLFPPHHPQSFATLASLKIGKACRSLRQRPHAEENRGVSCFCHHCTIGLSCGCGYILAEQRPDVRETQAALPGRGALFRLFCFPIPKPVGASCPIPFRFPALRRCAAAAFLSNFWPASWPVWAKPRPSLPLSGSPLPMSARVRWTLYGTSLTVKVL